MKIISLTIKKLLGSGRAWLTPKGFTSEMFDLLAEPLEEIKSKIENLRKTHFPVTYTDENNIINDEELFGIIDIDDKTFEQRASFVEGQWSILAGSQNYKQIELILQKKGFPIRVIENIPTSYNKYGARHIGNGQLRLPGGIDDPITITDGINAFIIQADDFMKNSEVLSMIEAVVKVKPAQLGIYFIPRFLRKKEIHHKLTKSQMQNYKKKQYCDCRVPGEI